MHYLLIYKKISELLFQISNASYFVFPFIDWQHSWMVCSSCILYCTDGGFINFTFGLKGHLPKIELFMLKWKKQAQHRWEKVMQK